jgi:hypothetical protein
MSICACEPVQQFCPAGMRQAYTRGGRKLRKTAHHEADKTIYWHSVIQILDKI